MNRAPTKLTLLIAGATVGLFLATTLPAAAQESFTNLQHVLRPGDTVFVTDDTGMETRGRVVGVGPFALRLTVDGVERQWLAARVWRVTRPDSVKNGAIAGLVTGGIIGGVGGVVLGSLLRNEGHDAVGPFFFLVGVGAGGGAAIGAGIDALLAGRTLIYERRVTVVPVVAPRAQGIQLAVRF